NDTWDWNGKLTGNYDLPWNVGLSASYQAFKGIIGQRNFIFRSLPQSSTLTLPVEPYGVLKNPVRTILNVRATKGFKLTRGMSIRAAVDVLNLMNVAPPYAVSVASGPTYGQYSMILNPRILKAGILLEF